MIEFKVTRPLFLKILIAVYLPLCTLLAGFSVLLLRQEIATETARCLSQGEGALQTIYSDYIKLFSDSDAMPRQNQQENKAQAEFIRNIFHIERIDIIDPERQESILSGENFQNSVDPVFKQYTDGVPESMGAKRQGHNYFLNASAKSLFRQNLIYGYVPFKHKTTRQILVLVAVFKTSFSRIIPGAITTLAIMAVLALIAGAVITFSLTRRIVKPLKIMNDACFEILNGKLGLEVDVKTGDELEQMARNFNHMSHALKTIKHKAQDSNPLTQLPGNQQIMAEMARRLEEGQKFVYFHIDIDHFKAYNDRYGLGRGDDVLKWTGNLLRKVLAEAGNPQNFVGHQGGDDYVLLVEVSQAEKIGKNFCKQFDLGMKNFYEEDVFKTGYFLGEDDRNNSLTENTTIKKHPLMSVSMAGISNVNTNITTCDDILEAAVRVKKKAKQIPYSKALIEELAPV